MLLVFRDVFLDEVLATSCRRPSYLGGPSFSRRVGR